ncbi:zinc-binding dehydrogenase [Nocardioides marmoriginsengisoli]|uniref:zinc-binding dehydrogenase n=1 Tax=Nocardioides marmoriginsengisoli TaxID=661483 RepID=UPI0011CDA719|nr:zinc-binding dehydrogenase [Nocardioides marmoriginsengisoli]
MPDDPAFVCGDERLSYADLDATVNRLAHTLAGQGLRAETADAIVEGFLPGGVERLGIGPEDVLARNPRIVYGRSYDDFADAVEAHTGGSGRDLVLDSVAGDVFDRSLDVLAPFGRLVTIGASSEQAPARLKLPGLWARSGSVGGVHIGNLLASRIDVLEAAWARLVALLEAGGLIVDVGLVLDPAVINQSFEALHDRAVDGRVVVDLTQGAPTRD